MESNGGDNRAVVNAGRHRNGHDSPQEHHKRNRSRRGNRGNNNGRGTDANTSQTNKTGEPPNKKRRNRKKKGNSSNNYQNTATDMEIDSVRPSEVVAMDTSHKCTGRSSSPRCGSLIHDSI